MTTLDFGDIEKRIRELDLEALHRYTAGLDEAPVIYKSEGSIKVIATSDALDLFVASAESEDRHGDIIAADGWKLDNYKKNPVFMNAHNVFAPPIGIVPKIWVEGKELLANVKWDEADPVAAAIKGKYQRGFMKGVSVGFRPLEYEERKIEGSNSFFAPLLFKSQELLEISAVSVPAHPNALRKALESRKFYLIVPEIPAKVEATVTPEVAVKADSECKCAQLCTCGDKTAESENKGALPYHDTGKADKGMAWDASAELAKADDVAAWRAMHAWVDSAKPENKTSYKLPHHKGDDGHAVVFRGVSAAIGALNGARGGTMMPDADRRPVYNHLAHHYRDFGETPPTLKSMEELEQWLVDIEVIKNHQGVMDKLSKIRDMIDAVIAEVGEYSDDGKALEPTVKAGEPTVEPVKAVVEPEVKQEPEIANQLDVVLSELLSLKKSLN